ncbi:unnamed protein product [Ilex paraguariensis]|uniref:NAB domain-containing protein n=1 Tax=Ilex paraguariensis TaxID=185542 RepID=A0ABC8UNB2_9AQUA
MPEEDNSDTFAGRAESYYRERPQLLALLQDLYDAYLHLADRYNQTLAKNHRRQHTSPIPTIHFDNHSDQFDEVEDGSGEIDSDVESSLSFQPPFPYPTRAKPDVDMIVAELVIKAVDYEILVNELSVVDHRSNESLRKTVLQKSLLEVLESERLILLNENARLGYRVTTLVEENKGLVSDCLVMKRKASELARCVLKMREDHRVCMLSKKIEDLQGQIYGLEKRNKEYYEKLVKQEGEKKSKTKKMGKSKNGGEVILEDCFQVKEEEVGGGTIGNVVNLKVRQHGHGGGGKKVTKMWDWMKKFDMFLCGPHFNSTC